MKTKTQFNAFDIETTAPLEKIGIIATQNTEGQPHITFINSLMAIDQTRMALGQFVRGKSKYFIRKNPKASFFILSAHTRKTWQGKLVWTDKKDQGSELEAYKEKPLQRYNSYFPIHRVHYFDLVETTPAMGLPVLKIAGSAMVTRLLGSAAQKKNKDPILNPYGTTLFNSLLTMKFLSFMGSDGFPCLVPFVPCMSIDSRQLVFPAKALGNHSMGINTPIAVFCLKNTMESVLVRGKFLGTKRVLGKTMGILDLDWVYNSMPPNAGQIYPEKPLKPVTSFE
ncbi:MAG: hypothetical protein JEZ12_21045 [Desulfobacterium sp.]|nr:hypothetical protein [Desulfobacterium sp.]